MKHSRNNQFLDAHVHLYPERRLSGLIRWMHSFFPEHPVPKEASLDDVLSDLRRHEYGHFVALVFSIEPEESSRLNAFIGEMAATVPGLIPFGCVHVADASPVAVVEEAMLRRGLAGLKFHPMVQRFDPWDSALFGVYERMDEWRKPIYIHTGFDEWYGYSLPESSLRSLLRTYPGIPFVFCHMVFPKLGFAFELVDEFPNLYLDATNVFGAIALYRRMNMEMAGLDLDEAREGMERRCDRIMFGTDHPAGMGSIEGILEDFRDFGLSPAVSTQILLGTASSFLNSHCSEHYGSGE
jgi:predicted TIM-barrel fold metal-dependent hydrolase